MNNPGRVPPAGVEYLEWIQCQNLFGPPVGIKSYGVSAASLAGDACGNTSQAPGKWKAYNMWSPRRNHQAAMFGETMFVIGGRAREHKDISRNRTVGGVIGGSKIDQVNDPRVRMSKSDWREPANLGTWREPSVLKNDAWRSFDRGETWELVNLGCIDPQSSLVNKKSPSREGFLGTAKSQCRENKDCFGDATCLDLEGQGVAGCLDGSAKCTCVCDYWSPRESHRVTVFGPYIYLVGGFVSKRVNFCGKFACGDVDAGSYREYMSDVWFADIRPVADRNKAARFVWNRVTGTPGFRGRGDHALVSMQLPLGCKVIDTNYHGNLDCEYGGYALFVIGGRTGNTENKADDEWLNDVW